MKRLDKVQTKNNGATNSQDSQTRDAQALAQAYHDTIKVESTGNLYAFAARDFIARAKRDYHASALSFMSKGLATEEWTATKMKLTERLESIAEKILRSCETGYDAKCQLATDLNDFKNEAIPAARQDFKDTAQASSAPKEGSMELHYLAGIERAIDIIYRIFQLHQIEDKTRQDSREGSEQVDEAVMVQAAHEFARERVNQLLHQYDAVSLDRSEKLLTDIESTCQKMMRVAKAAQGVNIQGAKRGIDSTLLLAVNGTFAEKIAEKEKAELEAAMKNPLTRTKNAVYTGVYAAAKTVKRLGEVALVLREWALDRLVREQGPQDANDEDDAPEVRGVMRNNSIREDYCSDNDSEGSVSPPVRHAVIHSPALSRSSVQSTDSKASEKPDNNHSNRSANHGIL